MEGKEGSVGGCTVEVVVPHTPPQVYLYILQLVAEYILRLEVGYMLVSVHTEGMEDKVDMEAEV